MKKIYIILLLIPMLILMSCTQDKNNELIETYSELQTELNISNFTENKNTLKKGTLYFCENENSDNLQPFKVYNPLENTYSLPKVEKIIKSEKVNRSITINDETISLSYSNTHRQEYMPYYIDEYVNYEYLMFIGYIENTETVVSFYSGKLKLFKSLIQPTSKNDYISICHEWIDNKIDIKKCVVTCDTYKRTTNNGVKNEHYDEFVAFDENTPESEIFYEFQFRRYIDSMPSAEVIKITLNLDGSLSSYISSSSGDFSIYENVKIDIEYIENIVFDGIQKMFNLSEYTINDFESSKRLMIFENKLCVLSTLELNITKNITGENIDIEPVLFLLPLT